MTTHTPGPWTYEVDDEGGYLSIKAGNVSVVDGCGCCSSPWMGGDDFAANARLIAAAPDLLKALKDPRSRYGWGNTPEEYFAAIAKGEGTNV